MLCKCDSVTEKTDCQWAYVQVKKKKKKDEKIALS